MSQPRQLVVLCDGTNNHPSGGREDTHVLRLAELLQACPDAQRLVFYDLGVGVSSALPSTSLWGNVQALGQRLAGLALGQGIYENIMEAYAFLMRHWQPGDQIFLLGFSRGAFTARSVAGLINQFGLLQPHRENLLPALLSLYFADRGQNAQQHQAITAQYKDLFTSPDSRAVEVDFVGVWDTVATVGLWPVQTRFTAIPTVEGKAFVHVRHALALDEHRAQFLHRPYAAPNGPHRTRSGREGSLIQLWFRGDHSDIGGGHLLAESALARPSFAWMVSEAVQCGLRLAGPQGLLLQEQQVLQALDTLPHQPDAQGPLRVHSAPRESPWWAWTGLALRDPVKVVLDDTIDPTIVAEAHPSVAQGDLRWPRDSVWSQPAQWPLWWWLALLATLVLPGSMDYLLSAPHNTWGGWWRHLWEGWPWPHNLQLFALQLQAPLMPPWAGAGGLSGLLGALGLDLLFMLAYGSLLAQVVAWSLAQIAGLRQVSQRPSAWLNRLARWALPMMLLMDGVEDLMTALSAVAAAAQQGGWAWICAVLICPASVAKWVGLCGVVALGAWGLMARLSRRP